MTKRFIPLGFLYKYLDELGVYYNKKSVRDYVIHNKYCSFGLLMDEIINYFNNTDLETFLEGPITRKFFDYSQNKKVFYYLSGILESKIKELYNNINKKDIEFVLKSTYLKSFLSEWKGVGSNDFNNFKKYSSGEYSYSDLYDIYSSMKVLSKAFKNPTSFIDVVKKKKSSTPKITYPVDNLVELIIDVRNVNRFLEIGGRLELLKDIKNLGGDMYELTKIYNKFRVPSAKKFIDYYTSARSIYGERFLEEFQKSSLYNVFNKKFGRYLSVGVPVSAGFTPKTYLWGIFNKMREMKK